MRVGDYYEGVRVDLTLKASAAEVGNSQDVALQCWRNEGGDFDCQGE